MSTQVERVARGSATYDYAAPLLARLTRHGGTLGDRTRLRAELAVAFLPS